MEDRSLELDSYATGAVVWVKLPGFCWWPAEVVEKISTEEKVSELVIRTYGDNEDENLSSVFAPKMIKVYNCSEQNSLIEKGRRKYQRSFSYRDKFDKAISMANEKLGIEEVTEATEELNGRHSPQEGGFEIKRKKLTCSDSNSASNNYHCSTPQRDTECIDHVEQTSSGSANKYDSFTTELLSTPTRMDTQRRSIKRSTKRPQNNSRIKGKKKIKSCSEVNQSVDVINSNTDYSKVTPCNSSSDNESEDDLPAVSVSQTPTKGYSSWKDVQSKDLVWVKHGREPYWPALVMKDGSTKNTIVRFFAYDGPEYLVKNKKNILPYFCSFKEKFEEEGSHNPALREACNEALWLLRSGKKECGSTAREQYEAIQKRRSLSQVTPCKRMTFTDDGTDSSSNDEPMESAFGYDITNNRTNAQASDSTRIIDEESPKAEVKSQFPKGSLYSFEILKESFLSLETELYSIFKGEIDSENHRIFFEGTLKERNPIQIQNRCGPLYYLHTEHHQELHDLMVSWVKKWSESEKKEVHEVKYVSDVLLPEATVRTIMKLEHLGVAEAWESFLSLDSTE